ncbi:MAG: 3-phosphoshikimate 1-carboxyvinyltransferase [Acidimicrobiaceae bacterium]|nr:3-phosphoshikimate 1-carboxyvinyltransferase [Acidimicrobiaceae bacterium]
MTRDVTVASRLEGSVRVPGDKSGSHRALLLSALADGESTIEGLSAGEDVRSSARIVGQLGARVTPSGSSVSVVGPPEGLGATPEALDCGNSGTTMRLLSGLLAGVAGTHHLVGDDSLSRRPMDRVAQPLSLMGARVQGVGERVCAPLTIVGQSHLRAIDYTVPVPSAQVKSAILLAGLRAEGETVVHEAVRTRPTTEMMLRQAGVDIDIDETHSGRTVRLRHSRPLARHWRVPADPSQAAFFVVLGALHPHAEIRVAEMDDAPERTGFLSVLLRMGAQLELTRSAQGLGVVARSSDLTATDIDSSEIPSVDEVPILAVAAAGARGRSRFTRMGELRLKESDRFAGSLALATSLGCAVGSEGDDFWIEGLGSADHFHAFEIDAGLDHRIVMSSAVAGVCGRGARIGGVETVASSYPNFFADLDGLRA